MLNFDHSRDSEWLLVGQDDQPVRPGEACTTFVASEEDGPRRADQLADTLAWRVQIRKGIHRPTRHAVTTLVDVVFSRSDIERR